MSSHFKRRFFASLLAPALLLAACGGQTEGPVTAQQRAEPALETFEVASPPPPPPAPAVAYAVPSYAPAMPIPDRERYDKQALNPVQRAAEAPVSTFSVDVDTGSYANVRRFLTAGRLPPEGAVRVEEMLNYFRYDYPRPADRQVPFSVTTDMAVTPWNPESRLLRVGLRGYDVARSERPAANLVFLVDVSGSMADPDKLPLVKTTLKLLADRLNPRDRVSIVVYAGAAGLVLEPTADKAKIMAALEQLEAGGSTAGGAGLKLAYATARSSFIGGGINRILLATDGDFNVGIADTEQLKEMVSREKEDGITLTTLGFGEGNYNEAMMEAVADAGNGNYAYIDSATEARKVLDEELSSTLFTIAQDVKIQIEFNPAVVAEYRLIGYENRLLAEEDFANDKVDAGDIGAGHRVTALYEVALVGSKGTLLGDRRYATNRPAPKAGPAGELAFLKLRYKLPGEKASKLIERPISAGLAARAGLPTGDMAFAAAVAAFGQRLRGGKYVGDFGYDDIVRLAGSSGDFYRQEFVKLAGLAGAQTIGAGSGDEGSGRH